MHQRQTDAVWFGIAIWRTDRLGTMAGYQMFSRSNFVDNLLDVTVGLRVTGSSQNAGA